MVLVYNYMLLIYSKDSTSMYYKHIPALYHALYSDAYLYLYYIYIAHRMECNMQNCVRSLMLR